MALHIPREPSRYLIIGAICAVANNIIYIGGAAIGLHYTVCILLTFVLILPAGYLAHALWTFDVALSWNAFGRFVLGSISSLLVASLAIWLFCGVMALPMVIAAPLATVAMTAYNFLVTRWALLRRKSC